MSPSAARLARRIALALSLAVAGLAAMHWQVQAAEAEQAASARARAEQSRAEAEPGPVERLGFPLPASDAPIHVAAAMSALAPDAAPVLEVLADGSLALRRPLPPSRGPLTAPPARGLLVPNLPTARWSPGARAAFVAAVGALAAARPVPAAQVRVADAPMAPADLQALLAWVP
jgi:hypothetical protein